MSHYVLDKAYRVAEANGIEGARVVVRGAAIDDCQLPADASAGGVLGVTVHRQPREGRFVAVRRLGIATATAAGPIPNGAAVALADNEGRVREAPLPRFHTGSLLNENALEWRWKRRDIATAGLSIEIVDGGQAGDFAWSLAGAILRITPPNDGNGIVVTAAQLVSLVEADSTLAALVDVAIAPGNSGSMTVSPQTASIANLDEMGREIGVAETPATADGDLLDVLLLPRA